MNQLIAAQALLPSGWSENVLFEWNELGILTRVVPLGNEHGASGGNDAGNANNPDNANGETPMAAGIVLPGMVNLHSHAFQRAMAGLTEFRSGADDNFWSWRTLMYAFAQKLTPEALKSIARQLYIEMLKAGYTSVCEFHYLHHDVGGKPYANPAEHAECLIAAAQEAGIGLTLLPVMYQHSGFGGKAPHAGQARFINSPEWMLGLLHRLQASHPQHGGLRYGVAPHSLRAVSPAALRELIDGLDAWDDRAPIHIHIAEQTGEVEDCIATLGARPVEWLLRNHEAGERWCLVHATHMTADETRELAASGAVAGICPTTEANLGDGIFNGAAYLADRGHWGIGSDSHISTSMREELRLFEYSQRLLHRQRNVLLSGGLSTGATLYAGAHRGGALASGRPVAGLAAGQRADLLVLDDTHPDLSGKRNDRILDSFIFCNHASSPVRDIMAGGRWVVRNGHHALEEASGQAYRLSLRGLLDA